MEIICQKKKEKTKTPHITCLYWHISNTLELKPVWHGFLKSNQLQVNSQDKYFSLEKSRMQVLFATVSDRGC